MKNDFIRHLQIFFTRKIRTDKDKQRKLFSSCLVIISGYVYLSRQPKDSSLVISTTANQDCPLSEGLHPLLTLDVWEHAYYLKHQNKRNSYIKDWWMLVDWENVEELDTWFNNKVHDEL